MKPICIPCGRFFRCVRSGFYFVEGMPAASAVQHREDGDKGPVGDWPDYKLWAGDVWRCPGCGTEIVHGVGREPIAEHYQPDYKEKAERLAPAFRVDDC